MIYSEDCRHTSKLTNHYGITTTRVSYHQHNEAKRNSELVDRLKQGQTVALVSDAGCPGISDPGASAVVAAISAGYGDSVTAVHSQPERSAWRTPNLCQGGVTTLVSGHACWNSISFLPWLQNVCKFWASLAPEIYPYTKRFVPGIRWGMGSPNAIPADEHHCGRPHLLRSD